MDDKQFKAYVWDVYFAGVCAIQFHPANSRVFGPDVKRIIETSANIADLMLQERNKRCLG